jgi:hypothetical protein
MCCVFLILCAVKLVAVVVLVMLVWDGFRLFCFVGLFVFVSISNCFNCTIVVYVWLFRGKAGVWQFFSFCGAISGVFTAWVKNVFGGGFRRKCVVNLCSNKMDVPCSPLCSNKMDVPSSPQRRQVNVSVYQTAVCDCKTVCVYVNVTEQYGWRTGSYLEK